MVILVNPDLYQVLSLQPITCRNNSPLQPELCSRSQVYQEEAEVSLQSTLYKKETQIWGDPSGPLEFRTFYTALSSPLLREGNLESHGLS